MSSFIPPTEHQVLVLLLQLVLLLGAARLLGQACRMIGQPSVVGELAAGVLLGPSVLGAVAPDVFAWVFPGDAVQSGMLYAVGWLGVLLLLVVTGFETDLTLISRLGRAVMWVGAGSLLLPFAFGLMSGLLVPDSFVGEGTQRDVFALFLATALTISSLPVIAKILGELKMLRRNFGQLTLAVAMGNDVIGWVLLGLIAGLAASGSIALGDLGSTFAGLLLFLALAAAIGQRLVDAVLHALRRQQVGVGGWVTVAVVIALGFGVITQALGVEAVLGAFVAGILLGRSRYARHDVEEQIETLTVSFLAPIFFATAGLRVDLSVLFEAEVGAWAVAVVAIATVSKVLGSWMGARLAGLESREGLALGAALNARGALGIVIAAVGLTLGVLNDASYAVLVVMSIATAMVAPPMLRGLVRGWDGSPEEQARLRREEQMANNILLRPGRVLLPARGGVASRYAATIVGRAFPTECPVTLLVVGERADEHPGVDAAQAALGRRSVDRTYLGGDPSASLVAQSVLGFDVVVSGTRPTDGGSPIGPIASAALTGSSLPVVLVRPPRPDAIGEPVVPTDDGAPRFRRVLLPVSAARPARAASEVAIALAASTGVPLHLLHVGTPPDQSRVRRIIWTTLRTHERTVASYADPMGTRLIEAAERVARAEGVDVHRVMRSHHTRATAITDAAEELDCDLIVLGVEVQDADGEPFLGQTAESVLASSERATVVVVGLPSS